MAFPDGCDLRNRNIWKNSRACQKIWKSLGTPYCAQNSLKLGKWLQQIPWTTTQMSVQKRAVLGTVPRPLLVDPSLKFFCLIVLRLWYVTALFKLVCVFQAPDEASLSSLSETLTQAGVAHKLWIEQPENIPTCLALKPCPKDSVQQLLRKFKLFKWHELQEEPQRNLIMSFTK